MRPVHISPAYNDGVNFEDGYATNNVLTCSATLLSVHEIERHVNIIIVSLLTKALKKICL